MEATSLAAQSSLLHCHPLRSTVLSEKPKHFPSLLRQCTLNPLRHRHTVRALKLSPVDSNVGRDSKILESEAAFYVEQVGSPTAPPPLPPAGLSLSDQAFFLFSFVACTTVAAMVGFVAAAVPAIFAMRRAAIALAKLADASHKEIPGTMAAVRLSGIEISNLILELSDLSHELSDGVSKSAQVVQAADVRIRQIISLAREHTMSMIEERANLPEISLKPVVAGAAKKTSHAVGKATRKFLDIISGVSENEDGPTQDM